eukprot:scaffold12920_cov22-Tisochrysis_lutea.AAC.1
MQRIYRACCNEEGLLACGDEKVQVHTGGKACLAAACGCATECNAVCLACCNGEEKVHAACCDEKEQALAGGQGVLRSSIGAGPHRRPGRAQQQHGVGVASSASWRGTGSQQKGGDTGASRWREAGSEPSDSAAMVL